MSVPAGFVELADSPEMRGHFPALGTNESPCFVRMILVRQSQITLFDWLRRRPAWVLYAGPVQAWQAPLVVEITKVAIRANPEWDLPQICSTWGSFAGLCRADQWNVLHEIAPVVPNNVKGAWPHTNALWSWVYEDRQPERYALKKGWGTEGAYAWVSVPVNSAST